ncbi:MAG: glycosyltransferase family 39 protein [Candidatus Eisenbacteria bacterium]
MRFPLGSRKAEAPLRYFLLAAVGAGLILRFVKLAGQSLWVDEIITLKNSHIGSGGVFSDFFSMLQGPLVAFLMHFWGALSNGDAFLRIPFAIAGAATIGVIYVLAKSLYDSWTALCTVFIAALSPILIWYSQEIRGYAFAVLFAVLMTYFFIQWLARPTTRNAFFYGLVMFAGLVSNLSVGFVAVAHFVYLIWTSSKRKLLGRWIVTVFAVLLVFSPWVREVIVRIGSEHAVGPSGKPLIGGGGHSALAVPYSFFTYSVGYTFGPSARELQTDRAQALAQNIAWIGLVAVTFGVPLVVGILRLARTNSNSLVLLLAWLLVPVIAVWMLAASEIKAFSARYALVSVPAYAMLLGQGLAAILKSRFWPYLGLVTAVMGLAIYNYFAVPAYGKEDMRSAAQVIEADFREGDVVVAVYTGEALEHYLKGIAIVSFFEAGDLASEEAITARCRVLAGVGDRVWLVLCREWMVDPGGVIKAWFDRNLENAGSEAVPGVRLYLYQKRSR